VSDPLDDADVGETVEMTETQRYSWWGSAGSQWLGEDRKTEHLEITDAYFDGEPGNEEVVLEISGEVTRRLPRGAFDFPEATQGFQSNKPPESTPRWKRAAKQSATLFIGFAVAVLVSVRVHNEVFSSLSGKTVDLAYVAPIGPGAVVFVLAVALVISATISYLPGHIK